MPKKKQKTAVRKEGSKNCEPLQGQQIQYEEVACGKHFTCSENLHCFLFEAVPMSNPRVEPSSARDLEEDVPFVIKRISVFHSMICGLHVFLQKDLLDILKTY